MRDKIAFIDLLTKDLLKYVTAYADAAEAYEDNREAYRKGKISFCPYRTSNGNRDFGKTALKRKITTLRHELLTLERMLDR